MKVLVKFADLEDGGRVYQAGENYPRAGLKPSDKRVEYLAGTGNKIGVPVIEMPMPTPKEPQKANKKEKEGE